MNSCKPPREGKEWWTRTVTTGKPLEKKDASKLLNKIAEGTWICGDPGLQYDGAIQKWHTCKGTEPIHSTNPCSEYVFLNNTACNLASLNLMKFKREDGTFDVERFKAAVRIFITAQEIIVDNASYPTKEIAENSHIFRTLGLGFANLGSLIMSYGLAYDSNEGRALAGAITSVMTGHAYEQSAEIAAAMGAVQGLSRRPLRACFQARSPRATSNPCSASSNCTATPSRTSSPAANSIISRKKPANAGTAPSNAAASVGYRNAQVTVLAPTGTIAFLMDCDTTGVEPDIALVKYKLLAGGGMLKIVNRTVPEALRRLGYSQPEIEKIIAHIEKYDTIEDVEEDGKTIASGLRAEHLEVFDCAFKPYQGKRSISYMAHLKMMGAAQPFISGAISKTVNLPQDCSVEDIRDAYVQAWKMGLKCVAIYRDGSKRSQPLNTKKTNEGGDKMPTPRRKPTPRQGTGSGNRPICANKPASPCAAACPTPAPPSRTNSTSPATRVISPSACSKTASPANCSSPWPRKVPPSAASWTASARSPAWRCNTACRWKRWSRNSPINASSPPASPRTPRSATLPPSPTTFSAGWPSSSSPAIAKPTPSSRNQPELAMPGLVEEEKKQVNRPCPTCPSREDTDIVDVSPEPTATATATSPKPAKRVTTLSDSVAHFQKDAPTCPNCGHVAVRNGACYKCLNCGESLGCS